MGLKRRGTSVVNQKPSDKFRPEGLPSDAWVLVENRPALLRRRRPQNRRVALWNVDLQAFRGPLPTASRSRLARGSGVSGRPSGPEYVGEFLTQGTIGPSQ